MHPVCFYIGSRPIYWYGVMMALAFMAGVIHWTRLGRHAGRDSAFASDLALWIMIGGVGGARIAYVAANWPDYAAAPWTVFRVDQGGLIYYGGFFGALAALFLFARIRHERLLGLLDFVATAVPLGHAIGRVGCFLNGCCGGKPVADWLAPGSHVGLLSALRPLMTFGLPNYPVQLYESAYNLVVYALLRRAYRRPHSGGAITAQYLMWYPAGRFFLEWLRGDGRLRWGPLDAAQYISLALFAGGLLLYRAARRSHERADRQP